jgi:hypothetical protein
MPHHITIELPDNVYAELSSIALKRGKSPEETAVEELKRVMPVEKVGTDSEAMDGLLRFAGAVNLGHPTGSDNEGIDGDLAREYGTAGGPDNRPPL